MEKRVSLPVVGEVDHYQCIKCGFTSLTLQGISTHYWRKHSKKDRKPWAKAVTQKSAKGQGVIPLPIRIGEGKKTLRIPVDLILEITFVDVESRK